MKQLTDLIPLYNIPFNEFKEFTDSLKSERDTWSLDYNMHYMGNKTNKVIKNEKEYWETCQSAKGTFELLANVIKIDNEIVGLIQTNLRVPKDTENVLKDLGPVGVKMIEGNKQTATISIVIKEKFQGQNIGTQLISKLIELNNKNNHYNIGVYTAIVNINNPSSYKIFIKNGFYNHTYQGKDQLFLCYILDKDLREKHKSYIFPKTIKYESPTIDNKVQFSPITNCISSFNNLNYLKLAIKSVRENSYFLDAPLIIHAENCQDGTDEWLKENHKKWDFEYYIEKNETPRGIGGGMNFCADKVKTEFINFLHADFYVSHNWDLELLRIFEKNLNQRMMVFSHRVQPNIFNEDSRSGTLIVPMDEFGEYHHNFDEKYFLDWSKQFTEMNDFEIRKSEGVSGLIKKEDWDYIGGNDDRFAPAYWEDADLFIRMLNENYKFVLTSKSMVYHFASRASRFPDDNLTTRPVNLAEIEQRSTQRFIEKYGRLPERDEHDFYIPLQIIDGTPNRINQ